MKKWFVYILMAFFAVGFAAAQDNTPGLEPGSENDGAEQIEALPLEQAPGGHMKPGGRPDMRKRSRISDEQRAEMKAHYEAIHSLAEAARAEADPVKKAELIEQLRAKLTEGAEKMQAEFSKRLENAEADVAEMKERLAKGEAEMAQRVEEHLQKLLAGEQPEHKGPGVEGQRHRPQPPE
ncbi:MAG: hypothetical protein ISR85_04340 [Kiritimatiellales bacterium]|nr:hypothetical protein [Kiritimatiellota bacterium]MBL7012139.1 hypothetical protein [Kiritimatiellales bacterium]